MHCLLDSKQTGNSSTTLTTKVFPMPETTYPWELLSGLRSNTNPVLGSLIEQAYGRQNGEETFSPAPQQQANTQHLQKPARCAESLLLVHLKTPTKKAALRAPDTFQHSACPTPSAQAQRCSTHPNP